MMTAHQIYSSQFDLVGGLHQPLSPMVRVAEPTALGAREARKGRLYLVVEVGQDGARGRDAAELAIRTIHKTFYEDRSYSVTSALRKALSAANKVLYQHNFNAVAQKRAVVGVTCAVVKELDLYLAQVAPGQAYLLAEGKLRALPTSPLWTGGPSNSTTLMKPSALGASLTIEPEFYRAVLHPKDALLLCTSNLAHVLSRALVEQTLRAPDAPSIVEAVLEHCTSNALTEAHGLAISLSPPLNRAAQDAPLHRSALSERGRLALRAVGSQLARVSGEAALLLKRPQVRYQQQKAEQRRTHEQRAEAGLAQLPPEPPRPPLPAVPPIELGASLDEQIAQERQERRTPFGVPVRPRSDDPLPPSAFLGEASYAAAPPVGQRIDLSDTPTMAAMGEQNRRAQGDAMLPPDLTAGERLARMFERLTDPISGVGRRRRRVAPPRAVPQVRRQPGLSYRREKPQFPWLQLLLLIAIVALAYVYGRSLLNDNAQRDALDTLTQAENAMAAVRRAPDEASAAQQLDAAAAAIRAVRSSAIVTATVENRKRLEAIQREYERQQAAIQKLTYFDDLTMIGQHPQASAGARFDTLIIPPPPNGITNTEGFSFIYALDTTAGVLYRMPKNGGTMEPFLSPKDVFLDGPAVGKVKAVAWREDNVVAIGQSEGGPSVYYFRENGKWRGSFLANSEDWTGTTENLRLITYQGNLYIWKAVDNKQILKYLSGHTGDPYDPWIKDDESLKRIAAATDVAIDGSIYFLLPNGRVEVFSANTFQREIVLAAVKPPLDVVPAFFVIGAPDAGTLFMLDTQKERIVELDKQTGALIQQIKSRPDDSARLDLLSAIYVDDQNGQQPMIYLVNHGQILRATLPSVPKPFREQATPAPTPPQ